VPRTTSRKRAELDELLEQLEVVFNRKTLKKWDALLGVCDRVTELATLLEDEPALRLADLRRAEYLTSQHDYPAALTLALSCIEYYSSNAATSVFLLNAVQSAGNSAWNLGDYVTALQHFEHSLRLSRELGLEHDESMSLTNLGAAHGRLGNYEQTIECYEASMAIKLHLDDIKGTAVVLGNLGNVYQNQGNYDVAFEYYQQSITRAYQVKDTAHIARMLNNLGAMHQIKREFPQALDYFFQALNLLREVSDAHPSIPTLLCHIGEIYHSLEQFDVASGYMSQALETVIKLGNPSRLHPILSSLGALYSNAKYGEFSLLKAKEYLKQALEIAQEINERPSFSKYTNMLAQIDYRLGNYAEAYSYLQNSIEYSTALNSEELEEKLRTMHVQHKVEQLKKEAEIARLKNTVLEVSNQHLEELNAIKNNFLGIAAHDLKNPLSSIKMLARMLEEYADKMTVEEVKNAAKDICTSSSQMFDLIVSLLDVNALEQGRVNLLLQITEVSELVRRTVDSYRSRAEKKGIQIEFEAQQCYSVVDSTKFLQIAENLISNAIKYSPHQRVVYITIGNSAPDSVRLSVRDEGKGIAPDEMHKLFAKFERLEAQPTGGEHSTGLGLSIVKQLAELMDGHVWCESVYGEGATFFAEFPAFVLDENQSAPISNE